jgi:HMG (high mobility group) box
MSNQVKKINSIISQFFKFQIEDKLADSDHTAEFVEVLTSAESINTLTAEILKAFGSTGLAKTKKLRDPKAPKRPLTSYLFFCKDKRAEFKGLNPDMKVTELSKILGSEWRRLSEKEKSYYVSKAEKDKKRYDIEMKDYERPSDEELLEEKVRRRKSSSDSVKKPISAYMFFSKDKRHEIQESNPEMSMKEVNSELGRLWREEFNTEAQREKWISLAEEDKERYACEKLASKRDQSDDLGIREDLVVGVERKKRFMKGSVNTDASE